MTRPSRNASLWMLAIVCLLGITGWIGLYLSRTIQYDEAFTFNHYVASPAVALLNYSLPNNHLLHSFLVWLSTTLVGDSVIAIRLPAFFAGVLSLALVFRLGYRIAGYGAGIVALVLLGTIYGFAEYMINARGYTLTIALTLILCEKLLYPHTSRRSSYTWVATCCALIMTLPSMIVLIAGLLLYIFSLRGMPRRELVIVSMMVGTLAGTFFYANAFKSPPLQFGYLDFGQLVNDSIGLLFSGGGIHLLLVLGTAMVLFGLAQAKYRLFLWLVGCILFSAIALAVVQGGVLHKYFYPRNYLYLAPFVALLGAIGLVQMPKRFLVPVVVIGIALRMAPLTLLVAPSLQDYAINTLITYSTPKDWVVADCCIDESIVYYLKRVHEFERLKLTDDKTRVIVMLNESPRMNIAQVSYIAGLPVHACQEIPTGTPDIQGFTCILER